jgi:hypothetical protein
MQESKIKALDEGNRAAARPDGFRGEADKTGREAGRNKKLESKRRAHGQERAPRPAAGTSWHNTAKSWIHCRR